MTRLSMIGFLLVCALSGQSIPMEVYPMTGEQSQLQVIQQGGDGTIWVGASSGLYRLAGGKVITVRGGRTSSMVRSIEEYQSTVWLGTLSGIFRWADGKLELVKAGKYVGFARLGKRLFFISFAKPGLIWIDLEDCQSEKNCPDHVAEPTATWRPSVGADGRLWFPCGKEICVQAQNGPGGESKGGSVERRGLKQGVPELAWEKCFVDRDGALWALAPLGVYRQTKDEAELRMVAGMEREGSRSDTLQLDAAGNALASGPDWLWLGARKRLVSTSNMGLTDHMIESLLGDKGGEVWLVLKTGSIARLKSAGRLETWGLADGFEPISTNHLMTADGTEWGTARSKILFLRPKSRSWQSIPLPGKKGLTGLFKAGTERLIADRPDGAIFELNTRTLRLESKRVEEIHTDGPSLVLIRGNELVWIRRPEGKPEGKEERISILLPFARQACRSFVEDSEGRLWFVTTVGLAGVNRDGSARLFTTRDGLRMNALQAAAIGPDNDLWIGYDAPSDVSVFRLPQGRLSGSTVLNLRHRPPTRKAESVFTFGFDGRKRVWKGTELGMVVMDPRETDLGKSWVMGESDGLPHLDVVMQSSIRYQDGGLGFNTLNGKVRVYEPEKLFLPGQPVSLNGVLEDGVAKIATMPAAAWGHVKLEYRNRSLVWWEGWKAVPGLEFAVGAGVEGIEVRVVNDYFYRGETTLRLGRERITAEMLVTGIGLVGFLGWRLGLLERLLFRWRKRRFTPMEEAPRQAAPQLLSGSIIKDRFRICERLASGNFSDVYAAEDVQNGNAGVVVKQLKLPDFSADFTESWLKRRFMQELGAATLLKVPGVLPVIDAWIEKQSSACATPYLVMRRVQGITLRNYLDENGRMEPRRAIAWLQQLSAILEQAHARGIIHCDLKPENIMLEPKDGAIQLIIIDFGTSALRLETDLLSHQTRPAGTAAYMAPEQLMGQYSPASDLYAFALIAMEMLTGAKYRDLDIKFDAGWEAALLSSLGKLGLPINVSLVFVRGLRFIPQEREQDLANWLRYLVAEMGSE